MEQISALNYVSPEEIEEAYKTLYRETDRLRSLINQGVSEHVIKNKRMEVELARIEVNRIKTLVSLFTTRKYDGYTG